MSRYRAMKKIFPYILFLLFTIITYGQAPTPETYGFKHLQTSYKGTPVDILIKSKKGDEEKVKPLFLFLQGSLPIPLFITDGKGAYGVFPFTTDSLLVNYHIAIIGKPYIPLSADVKTLRPDFTYTDSTGRFPKKYTECNLPGYYTKRNTAIVKYLLALPTIADKGMVVAGHSEGAGNAIRLAAACKKVSKVVYISGNPLGRIMSIVGDSRRHEMPGDTTTEDQFNYWQYITNEKGNMDDTYGDTNKATYDFSESLVPVFKKLKIPVLVIYGSKDASTPYNDYLRVECIRSKKNDITFKCYVGLEHNFFTVDDQGKTDYNSFGWDTVATDMVKWLTK